MTERERQRQRSSPLPFFFARGGCAGRRSELPALRAEDGYGIAQTVCITTYRRRAGEEYAVFLSHAPPHGSVFSVLNERRRPMRSLKVGQLVEAAILALILAALSIVS
jgi:hypothetical protein